MKRHKTPKKTSLKPRKPIPRRSPVTRVNAKRKAREWARAYGSVERVEWVKTQPCMMCGFLPSENVHITTGGMGRKSDAANIIPLCTNHHRRLHMEGAQSFAEYGGLDLADCARWTESRWQAASPRLESQKP